MAQVHQWRYVDTLYIIPVVKREYSDTNNYQDH